MTVEQRLNGLETAVRRQRIIIAGMILLLVGLVTIATAPLADRGDYKVLVAGEVARTLEGEDMKFSAVLEFETYEKALSYYDSPDYQAAFATMGPDVKQVVERNIVVVKGFDV